MSPETDMQRASASSGRWHGELLGWVVVDEKLRRVSEFLTLPREARRQARCPHCREFVTLKLGPIRIPHAAHKRRQVCGATGRETILHMNAKFHLAEQLMGVDSMKLRKWCSGAGCKSDSVREWEVSWDRVEVEWTVGSLRPDLSLFRGGDPVGALEVFVTHSVGADKSAALAALKIPWVEVRALDVLDKAAAWMPKDALPVRNEGPCGRWRCSRCEQIEQENAVERMEQEQREARRKLDAERARANCVLPRRFRVVDLYYPTGRHQRLTYLVSEEKRDGHVIAVVLQFDSGRSVRRPGNLDMNELALDACVRGEWEHLQAQGVTVDSPMEWHPDPSVLSWKGQTDFIKAMPCRYAWDGLRSRWSPKPGCPELDWKL